MDLRDAVLCIDCDNLFAIEGSQCNPRCPSCTSSVLVPLSAWVRTWAAFDRGAGVTESASARKHRIELVHSTPIAA